MESGKMEPNSSSAGFPFGEDIFASVYLLKFQCSMNERFQRNEWTNERTNEWKNERTNERTNERMNDDWTNEQKKFYSFFYII